MDSHSDAECSAASLKQTNKKKSQVLRTVSGVGLLSGKAKNKRFKRDLEQVVKVVDL